MTKQPSSIERLAALEVLETAPAAAPPGPRPDKTLPGGLDIFVRDPLRAAVEAQSGGRMTVLYDDTGSPNHMHVLPRFTYQDLGFSKQLGAGNVTAFEVNGSVKSEIFIGAYQSSRAGHIGCALPGAKPWVDITYDDAVNAAAGKGAGWHLMTAHEWAAIAFWCMANGFQPRGNTAGGSPGGRYSHELGVAYGHSEHLHKTGTGPVAWRHTGDHTGIADLVGNVLEWNSLIKLLDGEIVTTPDNDYMAPESAWARQGRYLNCAHGKVRLTQHKPSGDHTAYSVAFHRFRKTRGYASSQLLRRLLIEPAGIVPCGKAYIKDYGERMVSRGGEPGSGGGLAAGFMYDSRHTPEPDVGFRVAYID